MHTQKYLKIFKNILVLIKTIKVKTQRERESKREKITNKKSLQQPNEEFITIMGNVN